MGRGYSYIGAGMANITNGSLRLSDLKPYSENHDFISENN